VSYEDIIEVCRSGAVRLNVPSPRRRAVEVAPLVVSANEAYLWAKDMAKAAKASRRGKK
jgi:hypothetical protein